MKEKYEPLVSELIQIQNIRETCKHEWQEPIYDPDLFDGMDKWYVTCKLCGKKIISYQKPNKNEHTLKLN